MKVRYANSLDELQVKSSGLHHDHCFILYFGSMHKLLDKYLNYIDKKFKFIIIYEEL